MLERMLCLLLSVFTSHNSCLVLHVFTASVWTRVLWMWLYWSCDRWLMKQISCSLFVLEQSTIEEFITKYRIVDQKLKSSKCNNENDNKHIYGILKDMKALWHKVDIVCHWFNKAGWVFQTFQYLLQIYDYAHTSIILTFKTSTFVLSWLINNVLITNCNAINLKQYSIILVYALLDAFLDSVSSKLWFSLDGITQNLPRHWACKYYWNISLGIAQFAVAGKRVCTSYFIKKRYKYIIKIYNKIVKILSLYFYHFRVNVSSTYRSNATKPKTWVFRILVGLSVRLNTLFFTIT